MSSISRGQSSLTALRMIGDDMMITNYYVDFYMNKPVIFQFSKIQKISLASCKKQNSRSKQVHLIDYF